MFATSASLLADLRSLGVRPGDGIFVHASLSAIGNVVGGARAVVGALIEAVGRDGLLGMPGFSADAYLPDFLRIHESLPEEIRQAESAVLGFDLNTSPTAGMGLIAETFRTWPETLRSSHPCVSICLRGIDAKSYISPHQLDWATGPETPLGKLCNRPQMKILLIGVGWNRCSALHTAESMAPHQRTKIRRFKANPADVEFSQTADVADDGNRLFPAVGQDFESAGAVTFGRIGKAEARLCGYADLVVFASRWIDRSNIASGDTA